MVVKEFVEWKFEHKVLDWINEDINLPLSGYVPSQDLVDLLKYNININLE